MADRLSFVENTRGNGGSGCTTSGITRVGAITPIIPIGPSSFLSDFLMDFLRPLVVFWNNRGRQLHDVPTVYVTYFSFFKMALVVSSCSAQLFLFDARLEGVNPEGWP